MPQWLDNLFQNPYFIGSAMAVIIFLITQIIKLPYKLFTKKTIKNERTRKIANAVILLVPFGLGVLFQFLYATYYLKETLDVIVGLGYGTASISLYGIIERFFKIKIPNPYDTKEGKEVLKLVDDITADGKIDEADKSAVQEFLDSINKS